MQYQYLPRVGDNVIGVVVEKNSLSYSLDINGPHHATLDATSFDGATKRNKPNINMGALVYCRVLVANKDMDPEVSCIIAHGPKRDWMTGESIYGELKGGYLLKTTNKVAAS